MTDYVRIISMNLILGSQSIYRQKRLLEAGYGFVTMSADIDEKSIRSANYKELPLLIARAKTEALLPKIKEDSILITSDIIVVCNGEIREKPDSIEQAYRFLKSYSLYPAQTYDAIVVVNAKTHKRAEGVDEATVYFKKIPDEVIHTLIEKEMTMRVAGGFTIDDPLLRQYVEHIEGAEDSVLGLPLKMVEKFMEEVSL